MTTYTRNKEEKGKPNQPVKVVIIGASYGGLSTAGNLLDLCQGRPARFTYPYPEKYAATANVPVEITIIDERDGFCKISPPYKVKGNNITPRAC